MLSTISYTYIKVYKSKHVCYFLQYTPLSIINNELLEQLLYEYVFNGSRLAYYVSYCILINHKKWCR